MKWRSIRIGLLLILGALAVFEMDRLYLRPGRQLEAVNGSHRLDENRASCKAHRPSRLYLGNSIIHPLRKELEKVSGHTVWAVPGEFAMNLPKWLSLIEQAQPDTLVVNLGINDMLSGQPLFRVERHLEEVMFLCDSLDIVALFPGVLKAELRWSPYIRPRALQARIGSLNKWLAKITDSHASSYYLNFSIQFPPSGYTSDGVHLNEDGQRYWLRYLEHSIRNLNSAGKPTLQS